MRNTRLLKKGSIYHVIARVNRKEMIFQDKEIKQLYLKIMKRAKKKYKFTIINFCIMGNHVHMMIKPLADESLSKIMQWILSVFAIYYNKIHHLCGHVWYDRFKSKIIADIRQFLNTFFYITDNPVRAGIVEKPEDYELNGILFLKQKNHDLLDPPDEILLNFIHE